MSLLGKKTESPIIQTDEINYCEGEEDNTTGSGTSPVKSVYLEGVPSSYKPKNLAEFIFSLLGDNSNLVVPDYTYPEVYVEPNDPNLRN